MTTLQEELRQALTNFRTWGWFIAADGHLTTRDFDGPELADALLSGPLAPLLAKLEAVEQCYQEGRSQGYVLDSTLRRALDSEARP